MEPAASRNKNMTSRTGMFNERANRREQGGHVGAVAQPGIQDVQVAEMVVV